MIANGIVLVGLRTLPTGAVAPSKPSIANKVRVTAVATLSKVTGVGASGDSGCPVPVNARTTAMTASRGRSLISTVTKARPPAARTPLALTAWTIAVLRMATTAIVRGSPIAGKTCAKAAAVAMAVAATAVQPDTQNAQVA